jgi:hypothetical protein
MHGLSVAGKLTELDFNDDNKSIEVCAKIVDDAEWNKVIEGCYTGFSVGGKYGKRWDEIVDGSKVKKFEAIPNEVSIVDNPCVPSATFAMFKADGAEEQIMFKAAQEQSQETEETPQQADEPTGIVSNEQVAAKATEMAKAADDGSDWTAHIEAARAELLKTVEESNEASEGGEGEKTEVEQTAEAAPEADAGETTDVPAEKVTPAGVMQKWTTSDGKIFDKKADAVTHEESLIKTELTEAEQLAARLAKALAPEADEEPNSIFSLERVDQLHKAVLELEQPRGEDGAPLLEKGMYTVSRFASMLGDIAGLARTIQAEGSLEGGDTSDDSVAKTLKGQLGSFGESFMTYAKDQIAELVAGIDMELTPRCAYDYYYRAAGEGNDLAKDVVELIESVEDRMEQTAEGIEKLAKMAGFVSSSVEQPDELSPPMQKRFDELEEDNEKLKKVASAAVEKVEELAKRMKAIEDTPMPRALIGKIALKEGDTFLGKDVTAETDRMAILHDMLKEHGPDGMATLMIKAAQQNGQQLSLKQ